MAIDILGFLLQAEVLYSIVILLGFVFVTKVIGIVIDHYIRSTVPISLNGRILRAMKWPIYLIGFASGLFIALLSLPSFANRSEQVSQAFFVVLSLIAIYLIARIATEFIEWYALTLQAGEGIDSRFVPVVRKFVTILIYAVGIALLLNQLGVRITALIASLGILSLAIALGLQDTLSNFFAGLYIMADKPARPGDYIRLENGMEGVVDEIGWRSTKIRLPSDTTIIIPNSKLSQNILTNYDIPSEETSITIPLKVSYSTDLAKVEKSTIKVAKHVLKTVEGGASRFEPLIRYTALGDSNVEFLVTLRVKNYAVKALLIHQFIREIVEEYKKQEIKKA